MASALSSAVLSDCRPDPPSCCTTILAWGIDNPSWCRLSLVELAALEALDCTREPSFDFVPLPGAVDGREWFGVGVDCLDNLPILTSFSFDLDVCLEWVDDALEVGSSGVTLFDFDCWGSGVCRSCALWTLRTLPGGLALPWGGAVCTRAPGTSWLWATGFLPFLLYPFLCIHRRDLNYVRVQLCPLVLSAAAWLLAGPLLRAAIFYLFFQPPPGLGSSVNYPLSPQRFKVISCRHVLATRSKKKVGVAAKDSHPHFECVDKRVNDFRLCVQELRTF